jgi:hypothetical protein
VLTVDMSHEARRPSLSLPLEATGRFKELADRLRKNPHRLPPWCDGKSLGREGAKEVFRARVGEGRPTYVFGGHVFRFTRFRLRRNLGYSVLPKF